MWSIGPALGKVTLLLSLQPPALGVPEFPFHEVTYGMKSSVSMATITRARPLTMEGAVKRTLEVDISLEVCACVFTVIYSTYAWCI